MRFLCFEQQTVGDLIARKSKVVGSAQRKYRQALMQHGSILLRASPFAPQLPGIEELTDVTISTEKLRESIQNSIVAVTGWLLRTEPWQPDEMQFCQNIVINKYADDNWNERR